MSFVGRMDTPDHLLQLFQEYSIEGSNGVITSVATKVGGGIKQIVASNEKKVVHNVVEQNKLIAFVELLKSTTGAQETDAQSAVITDIATRKGGAIDASDFPEITRQKQLISTRFANTESRRGKSTLKTVLHAAANAASVPCYFLPWNPTGGAVELKIPDTHGAAVSDAAPILFLTAALSGCSIYVKGPANNPTIFHCGTQSETTGATASAFWDSVMSQLGEDPTQLSVAHNKDYTIPNRGTKDELKAAHAREKEAKKVIASRFKDTLEVEEMATWGAVFGIRTGSNWKFYMQENCTVTYHKIRKTKYLGRRVADGPPRIYSRPAFCREIFPTGGAKAQCFQHLRALKV